MTLLLTLLYLFNALLCLLMAESDADTIQRGDRVRHGFNAVIHLLLAGVIWLAVGWMGALASLVQARVVFDLSLNVLRFGWKGLFYVSPTPESIIDRLEKSVFGSNGWLPKLFYTAAFIGLLFLVKNQ